MTCDSLTYITIYESYVGRGAPSNASGEQRGYGWTPEQAHANAQHWANQAPWARVRKLSVADVAKPGAMLSRDERIAWAVVGTPGEFVPPSPLEQECVDLIGRGRYATAIAKMLGQIEEKG